jgi:hypothetical protein
LLPGLRQCAAFDGRNLIPFRLTVLSKPGDIQTLRSQHLTRDERGGPPPRIHAYTSLIRRGCLQFTAAADSVICTAFCRFLHVGWIPYFWFTLHWLAASFSDPHEKARADMHIAIVGAAFAIAAGFVPATAEDRPATRLETSRRSSTRMLPSSRYGKHSDEISPVISIFDQSNGQAGSRRLDDPT